MNKKLLILISSVFILLIIFIASFLLIKIDSKETVYSSIYNTIDTLKKEKYKNNIQLSINTIDKNNNKQINKINYKIEKDDNKYYIDMNQYTNGTKIISSENYLEKSNNEYNLYLKINNKWNKTIISDIKSKIKFNVDYSNLVKQINNYNYLGKETINGIKLNKYSLDIDNFNAYNLLYSSNIMDKNDMDGKTKLYMYINKKENLIYKIEYKINNVKNSNIKMNYNIKINNVFDDNIQINIPNI